MLSPTVARSMPSVGSVAPQQTPRRPDLLRDAAAAYDAQETQSRIYRELAIGREFKQRFGVCPEPPTYVTRTDLSKSGVWTFQAAGLSWKGGDDGAGTTRVIWFAVADSDGSWHQASTKQQLGALVRRGVRFEVAP